MREKFRPVLPPPDEELPSSQEQADFVSESEDSLAVLAESDLSNEPIVDLEEHASTGEILPSIESSEKVAKMIAGINALENRFLDIDESNQLNSTQKLEQYQQVKAELEAYKSDLLSDDKLGSLFSLVENLERRLEFEILYQTLGGDDEEIKEIDLSEIKNSLEQLEQELGQSSEINVAQLEQLKQRLDELEANTYASEKIDNEYKSEIIAKTTELWGKINELDQKLGVDPLGSEVLGNNFTEQLEVVTSQDDEVVQDQNEIIDFRREMSAVLVETGKRTDEVEELLANIETENLKSVAQKSLILEEQLDQLENKFLILESSEDRDQEGNDYLLQRLASNLDNLRSKFSFACERMQKLKFVADYYDQVVSETKSCLLKPRKNYKKEDLAEIKKLFAGAAGIAATYFPKNPQRLEQAKDLKNEIEHLFQNLKNEHPEWSDEANLALTEISPADIASRDDFYNANELLVSPELLSPGDVLHELGAQSPEDSRKAYHQILQELEKLPESKQSQVRINLQNFGFKVHEYKSEFFAATFQKLLGKQERKTPSKSLAVRFLERLGAGYKQDAENDRTKIREIEQARKSKTKTKFFRHKFANAVMVPGLALSYGRLAADATGLTPGSIRRAGMALSMATVRGARALKEAELLGKEALWRSEKHDEANLAKDVEQTLLDSLNDRTTRRYERFNKLYSKISKRENIKQGSKPDLLIRVGRRILRESLQGLTHTQNKFWLDRINKKIQKVEASTVSPEEKFKQKQKILQKNSAYLKELDKLVTRFGTVDQLAASAALVEKGARVATYALMVETLGLAIKSLYTHLPYIAERMQEAEIDTVSENDQPITPGVSSTGTVGTEAPSEQIDQSPEDTAPSIKEETITDSAPTVAGEEAEVLTSPEAELEAEATKPPTTPSSENITQEQEPAEDRFAVVKHFGAQVAEQNGKAEVTFDFANNEQVKNLDQALRRIAAQEYNLGDDNLLGKVEAARLENVVGNLRELLSGKEIAGIDPDDLSSVGLSGKSLQDIVNFENNSLKIEDYQAFKDSILQRLFDRAEGNIEGVEGITQNSDAINYVNKTSLEKWQEMLEAKSQADDLNVAADFEDADQAAVSEAEIEAESVVQPQNLESEPPVAELVAEETVSLEAEPVKLEAETNVSNTSETDTVIAPAGTGEAFENVSREVTVKYEIDQAVAKELTALAVREGIAGISDSRGVIPGGQFDSLLKSYSTDNFSVLRKLDGSFDPLQFKLFSELHKLNPNAEAISKALEITKNIRWDFVHELSLAKAALLKENTEYLRQILGAQIVTENTTSRLVGKNLIIRDFAGFRGSLDIDFSSRKILVSRLMQNGKFVVPSARFFHFGDGDLASAISKLSSYLKKI